VKGGGDCQLDLEEALELLPECGSEPHVAVGNKLTGGTMTVVNVVEVESCGLLGRDNSVGGLNIMLLDFFAPCDALAQNKNSWRKDLRK
jgi:hypothetical protein